MGLVDYSDSDDDPAPSTAKRQKTTDGEASELPPLPAAFGDLYSSTVRASTHDDPSLHGGRKRITPHVAGHWPAHVYFDWSPCLEHHRLLSDALTEVQRLGIASDFHSLLDNDLSVHLPLHVSLSRPLVLKTEQKDDFLPLLRTAISATHVRRFDVRPLDLVWHPNEDRSRWFLVLRLQRPQADELRKLLKACNDLAASFNQPLLYYDDELPHAGSAKGMEETAHDSFHVSVAWSLVPVAPGKDDSSAQPLSASDRTLKRLQAISIGFSEVKVRVGQDVTAIPLQKSRTR